jgi:hypothetical protein
VGDTVEGYATSLTVNKNARELGINLKLLNYLISIYEKPRTLNEDKAVFYSLEIEPDLNFDVK